MASAEGATGYVICRRYAKEKVYHSQDTRENKAVISTLTKEMDDYFVVNSFNESYVTFGKHVVGTKVF